MVETPRRLDRSIRHAATDCCGKADPESSVAFYRSNRLHFIEQGREIDAEASRDFAAFVIEALHHTCHALREPFNVEREVTPRRLYPRCRQDCPWWVKYHVDIGEARYQNVGDRSSTIIERKRRRERALATGHCGDAYRLGTPRDDQFPGLRIRAT